MFSVLQMLQQGCGWMRYLVLPTVLLPTEFLVMVVLFRLMLGVCPAAIQNRPLACECGKPSVRGRLCGVGCSEMLLCGCSHGVPRQSVESD